MAVIDSAVLLLQGKNYSGSGNWLDESGGNHDGVITGATFSVDHFEFGTGDKIVVAHHADLDFTATDNFTLMVVVETADATPTAASFLAGKKLNLGTGNKGYCLYLNTTGYARPLISDDTVPVGLNTPSVLSDNTKHVVAMVRDYTVGDDLNAFLDGTPTGGTADTTTTTLENALAFTIGVRGDETDTGRFNGSVYAVAVWATALSDADVATAGQELTATANNLTAAPTGTGTVTASVDIINKLSAVLSGTGTLVTQIAAVRQLAATLEGTSTVAASPIVDTFTMTPNGDQTGDSNVINEAGSPINTYLSIDDDPTSPVLTDYVFTTGMDGYQFYDLTATPTDFETVASLKVRADIRKFNVAGSTISVYAQLFASDEVTNWTDEVVLATEATADGLVETDFTVNGTGLAATKSEWDAARVKVRWDYT